MEKTPTWISLNSSSESNSLFLNLLEIIKDKENMKSILENGNCTGNCGPSGCH